MLGMNVITSIVKRCHVSLICINLKLWFKGLYLSASPPNPIYSKTGEGIDTELSNDHLSFRWGVNRRELAVKSKAKDNPNQLKLAGCMGKDMDMNGKLW